MEKLIEMLNYYLNACASAKDYATRRTLFDQATGATQMYCFMNIKDETQVLPMWEDYRKRFEQIVYGV